MRRLTPRRRLGAANYAELLQRAAVRLLDVYTREDVALVVGSEAAEALGGAWAGIAVLDDEDVVHVSAAAGGRHPTRHHMATALPAVSALAVALRNASELLPSDDGASAPELGAAAIAVLPLATRDGSACAVVVGFPSARRLRRDELGFGRAIATLATEALTRARLIQDERRARQRTERLQRVTTALSEAVTPQAVADVVVSHGVAAVGAAAAAVLLRAEEGDELTTLATAGYADASLGPSFRMSLSAPRPLADTTRVGVSLYLESAADWHRRYPNIVLDDTSLEATAVVPVRTGERVLGVMTVSFEGRHVFAPEERELLETIAVHCAQALERAALYSVERKARAVAEAAERRLRALQQITDAALSHLGLEQLLPELLERLLSAFNADAGAVLLLDSTGRELHVAASKNLYEPGTTMIVPVGRGIAGEVAATGKPKIVPDLRKVTVARPILQKRVRSLAGVPLRDRSGVVGVMHIGSLGPREFTQDDVEVLQLAAERIALAIAHARVYDQQRSIALTLQRSLLPDRLPSSPGLAIAARYLPGGPAVEVGGDWYDAVPLADGGRALVIGDVVGHDLSAAALMGQLRSALRAYLVEGHPPATALRLANRLLAAVARDQMATVAVVLLSPVSGILVHASAGHPRPLLLTGDGQTRFLDGPGGAPLGAVDELEVPESEYRLHDGDSLILYTDGLVERRGEPIDAGLGRLAKAAAAAAGSAPGALADTLVDRLGAREGSDDVALVVVRREPVSTRTLQLELPRAPASVTHLRDALRTFLYEAGTAEEDVFPVLVAACEAAANAVQHAGDDDGRPFRLTATERGGMLEVRVEDDGRWRVPQQREERGRGMMLMRSLMDDVAVTTNGGTHVVLRRQLGGSRR